jgi:uncharacterized protein YbgA (DUF1722 family)/uncharacterized protein YbbK (DUF523 family)
MKAVRIGISACLLGQRVRYDGGHKYDPFLAETLGKYVEFVPVCPEVECGLPIPRESMRLTGDPQAPRLVTARTGVDHTERMIRWAQKRVVELESERLCGFIFKSKSPSSGMERIRVYNDKGIPGKTGTGLFAGIFRKHFPLLPVEDEGRLHDPVLRENFIERIFVFQRWRDLLQENPTRGGLVDFHTRHKLLLLAHSPQDYRTLGKSVANAASRDIREVLAEYQTRLMKALTLKATPGKHANVLHHLLGYFKKRLSADEKQELLEIIENYRAGHLPLIVPITIFNHYVRKYQEPYLQLQYYLNPHPLELQLRNHV